MLFLNRIFIFSYAHLRYLHPIRIDLNADRIEMLVVIALIIEQIKLRKDLLYDNNVSTWLIFS